MNEIFNAIVKSPIEKRKQEWVESITAGLIELEKKVESFSIDELKNNEVFISVLLEASQIAIKNHQKEKLNALKNGVLNSATTSTASGFEKDMEERRKIQFLYLIDRMFPEHIEILKYFSKKMGGGTMWRDLHPSKYFDDFFMVHKNKVLDTAVQRFTPVIYELVDMKLLMIKKSTSASSHDDLVEEEVHSMYTVSKYGQSFLEFIEVN